MHINTIKDIDIHNRQVLIRVDFNVPVESGRVTSDNRIRAALPTIQYALSQNARVVLLSHLGRPKEGVPDEDNSLAPVATALEELLGQPVRFVTDWLEGITLAPGEVVLCENVRFNSGEKANDDSLAQQMAALADVFVMDAFATAHRAEASTYGLARYAPRACAGLLLDRELSSLSKALLAPQKPLTAIVGGSKVSTKLTLLDNLCEKVDQLIVGGGIANTFLVAAGYSVGGSLYEKELVDSAREIIEKIRSRGGNLPLPVDVRVARSFDEHAGAQVRAVEAIGPDEMILDVGPQSEQELARILAEANTIVWNGPVGVFEFEAFASGTRTLARTIADSHAFSIAGGGDTIAAIEKFGVAPSISYISTAGGAFLEFLEGKTLPAVEILQTRTQENKG